MATANTDETVVYSCSKVFVTADGSNGNALQAGPVEL